MLELLGYVFLVCVLGLAVVYCVGIYKKARAYERSINETNEIVEMYKLQMQIHPEAINWEDAHEIAEELFS